MKNLLKNIDKTEPEKFYQRFIQVNDVKSITETSNQLQTSTAIFLLNSPGIKGYDREIQGLVFENYTKFVQSIDTIKKVRRSIFS